MGVASGPARSGWVVLLGLWVGTLEVLWLWLTAPELAGAFADRVGTVAWTLGAYGALSAAAGFLLGGWPRLAPRVGSTLALAALALPAAGSGAFVLFGGGGERSAAAGRTNVILVSIDALRADHLDAYGYPWRTAPNLNALALDGTLFRAAISPTSWTLPAHVSMLTGRHPLGHGVVSEERRMAPEEETLATLLSSDGYTTGAWVGTPAFGNVGSRYGFDRGFDFYRHWPHPKRFRQAEILRRIDEWDLVYRRDEVGNATAQVDSVIGWLRGQRREPFFLFLHFYDVHSKTRGFPYAAPPPFLDRFCRRPIEELETCRGELCATRLLAAVSVGKEEAYTPEEIEILRCLYDGGIAFMDAELGRLFAALEEEALDDETAVIVTSDHGQGFFAHGEALHSSLYEEITRVPLIVRVPGGARGVRASGVVRLLDLAPTILELTGTPVPDSMQGRSLLGIARGEAGDANRPALSVVYGGTQTSLREGRLKLIRSDLKGGSRHLELFDLARDPGEQSNLATRERALATRLEGALDQAVEGYRADATEAGKAAPLREDEIEQLRALGYLE